MTSRKRLRKLVFGFVPVLCIAVGLAVVTPKVVADAKATGGGCLEACTSNSTSKACSHSQCSPRVIVCLGSGDNECHPTDYCTNGDGCGSETKEAGGDCY